jgi:class 3 adenylate cyclase
MNPAPNPPGDRIATILFADLLGFEALAAQRGPDEAFAIVTRCLRRLDEIARRHGGAVDKYLGDCLMAVFGFPVASARAEEETVAAAEEMLRAVDDTRRELDLGEGFAVRIGANTGEILAGKLGGTVIREFAVIGDAVNVAARLKDLAPPGRAWAPPAVTAWTTTATTAPT